MELKKIDTITDEQIAQKGVQALADRPNLSAQYGASGLSPQKLKLWFDQLATFLAKRINMITSALSSEDAAAYIRVCLDDYGVKTFSDLVDSFTNGVFATKILKLLPSANASEKQALQTVINSIAREIADLQVVKMDLPNVLPTDRPVVVGKFKGNSIYYEVGGMPHDSFIPLYDQDGCLKTHTPSGTPSQIHVVNYYKFNTVTNELYNAIALANEKVDAKEDKGDADNKYYALVDRIETVSNEKLSKVGGAILGNLTVQGNLSVEGKTTIVDVETVNVEDNLIVINKNAIDLIDLAGLAINASGTNTTGVYGIMYDPVADGVKLGFGFIDENGNFHYYSDGAQGQFLATVDWTISNGNLAKFNQEKKTFEDSGISAETVPHKSQIPQVWRY